MTGTPFGCSVAVRFAASYPAGAQALVLAGGFAKMTRPGKSGFEAEPAQVDEWASGIARGVGLGGDLRRQGALAWWPGRRYLRRYAGDVAPWKAGRAARLNSTCYYFARLSGFRPDSEGGIPSLVLEPRRPASHVAGLDVLCLNLGVPTGEQEPRRDPCPAADEQPCERNVQPEPCPIVTPFDHQPRPGAGPVRASPGDSRSGCAWPATSGARPTPHWAACY